MAAAPEPGAGAAARAARRRRRRTARSARSSACRSPSQPGAVLALLGSNGAGKTTIARVCSGPASRRPRARCSSTATTSPAGGRIELRAARHRARARRPLGVRVAHRRGEPRADVPAQPRPRAASRAALDEAYELFPRLGERRTPARGHALGRRAAHAVARARAGRAAAAAHRRRAVARPRADHRRRGVPHARDDPRRGHDAADRRAARAPRARRSPTTRSCSSRARSRTRARCRSSAICRRACSASPTRVGAG